MNCIEKRKLKTIGVIGGVGPEATLDLYRWIIKLTPTNKDQDHIPTVINSQPQIPDRTQALLYGGDDPLPRLIHAGQTLAKAGVDFIIIPCNTAHAFLPSLQQYLDVPILSMIDETVREIESQFPQGSVGLLATTGTVKTLIYEDALRSRGLEVILPDKDYQEKCIMEAVYGEKGIKAGYVTGRPAELLVNASQHLINKGAQVLIMGCTEIPLVLERQSLLAQLINPTRILAQAAVDVALQRRSLPRVEFS